MAYLYSTPHLEIAETLVGLHYRLTVSLYLSRSYELLKRGALLDKKCSQLSSAHFIIKSSSSETFIHRCEVCITLRATPLSVSEMAETRLYERCLTAKSGFKCLALLVLLYSCWSYLVAWP